MTHKKCYEARPRFEDRQSGVIECLTVLTLAMLDQDRPDRKFYYTILEVGCMTSFGEIGLGPLKWLSAGASHLGIPEGQILARCFISPYNTDVKSVMGMLEKASYL